ncbi:aryl hydrocarbon receptor repressor isoform X2 [Pleurodeles waltl]|uniref:aryl hydrocarbon receptor repressor isoform X2 n=1 Tax=Pleurodeles waltl TaxID=8319 RepID=UPI00370972A6
MIPPGECMYAGRKRRKPVQKQPAVGNGKSNPSKRHRDRLNAELDHLASLLPLPPESISKLDKLSVLRLSVSYLRVKSFFQALQEQRARKQLCQPAGHAIADPALSAGDAMPEGHLLQESLNGFALVVSAEGMIFYASSTIVEYLGFHQTDVMHQNVYDYVHVDDRQEFCKQLHWAMKPQQLEPGKEPQAEAGEEYMLNKLFNAQERDRTLAEYSTFLNRCFVCRVRCLLDSTSGFLTMQFQGKLKFLFGQKKKASSGALVPPQLALFCVVVPVLIPSLTELKMKSMLLRAKFRAGSSPNLDTKSKSFPGLGEAEFQGRTGYQGFSDKLHSAENQIKLMSSRENGVSLFKVRTNDDQWIWVEANTQHLYRNGCSEFVIVPPQSESDRKDEEELKRPDTVLGVKEARGIQHNSASSETGQTTTLNWTTAKQEKEEIKVKFELNKSSSDFTQDEPLNFCKSFSGTQNHCTTNSTWSIMNPTSSRTISQHISQFTNRNAKSFYCGDQSDIDPSPNCRVQRGSSEALQAGLQQFITEGYATEGVKSEGTLMSSMYEPGLPLDIPIKTENDSDSESGLDLYMSAHTHMWQGQGGVLKKQLLGFPESLYLKTEPNHRGHQSACQRPKYLPHFPHNGQCKSTPSHSSSVNICRPLKGTFHKEVTPFCLQKCSFLDSMVSLSSPDCYNNQFYGSGSMMQKALSDPNYKLQYELKGHGLVQTIKKEPLDSPPWTDREPDVVHTSFAKHMLPNYLQNSMHNKATEFAFLQ